MIYFSGDKKFKCDECHAKYSLKFNLNRHKRRVHNNDPKGDHTRCEICGLWFRVAATFRTHCYRYGILLSKLFWPTARKKCSSDRETLLKFEAEDQEFARFLRLLEQFIQTVKGHLLLKVSHIW